MDDRELKAMMDISAVLEQFEEAEQPVINRILSWVFSRYSRTATNTLARSQAIALPGGVSSNRDTASPETAADLLSAVRPQIELEKAVTIAYWLQIVRGQPEFGAQEINTTLKNIGYPVRNITDAFTSAMNRRPALVLQTQKSGTSKQARKQYKLTTAGVQWVQSRLAEAEAEAQADQPAR